MIERITLPGETAAVPLVGAESEAAVRAARAADARLVLVGATVVRARVRRVAVVVRLLPTSDANEYASVLGERRVVVQRFTQRGAYARATVRECSEPTLTPGEHRELGALRRRLTSRPGGPLAREAARVLRRRLRVELIDELTWRLRAAQEVRQEVLLAASVRQRLDALLADESVADAVGGSHDDDVADAAAVAALPDAVRRVVRRDRARAGDRNRDAVRFMLRINWNAETPPRLNLARARHELDRSHAGMEDVKDAVLDYLAMLEWQRRQARPAAGHVLCLVGAPGTGKTSIAATIAAVLGRTLIRIGMAGVDDVVLAGADRSYSQSRPGIFVRVLASCRRHPTGLVFLLDELDKVADYEQRSPVPALLALLDPEQNHAWRDHFFDELPVDLSGALFIATANDERSIASALLDRLQVIHVPAYSMDEQVVIGQRHILPRLRREMGIRDEVHIPKDVVRMLVFDYRASPGMRMLRQRLQLVLTRALRWHLDTGERVVADAQTVRAWLPVPVRPVTPATDVVDAAWFSDEFVPC